MAPPRGTAAYKKKDGILTVSDDQKSVIWTPVSAPGGPPTVSLIISNITNLQQTPDTAAKVMLKIFEKAPEGAEPVSYLFHFNSTSDPRGEANAVKDLLSRLLAESRSNDPNVPRPVAGGAAGVSGNSSNGSGSASMAFASAANSKQAAARFFDDNELKSDIALQQSLMKADRNLHQMYMEARTTKPESMSDATFNVQFWSTRLNLLRAHAIETSQKKGPYNVLSVAKPTTEPSSDPNQPGRMKLSITVEQVQLIFQQHPLVKRIYNENVPPLSEGEFWERFFLSNLVDKLRGARPTRDKHDRIFDKYDEYEDVSAFSSKQLTQHVPHIIDVEGNEENQGGFKGGNRKDVEMRPRGWAQVPIIQILNSTSGKLLSSVIPPDTDLVNSSVSEEDTYGQLALRDLREHSEEQKIILNIREQSSFFSSQKDTSAAAAEVYANQVPSRVLSTVQRDLGSLHDDSAEGIDLHAAIGIDDDSDSDEESKKKKKVHVGSRASRNNAQKQVLDSVLQRRAQLFGHASDETRPMGLPEDITAKCRLTHATTMEFVNQFWSAFLSGDSDRALELGYLVESLRRCKERIDAVAAEAEKAREKAIDDKKQEIVRIYNRTKRKTHFNPKSIRGGRDAVEKLMSPVVHALDKAIADYQRALAAEGIQASTES
ncbi:RNA polymerase II transcription factor-related protein [Xylariales sp. PMI_506]|nr:RNA polymerase II transcription factor-related protein [Xylariales sp. PMI_506]